MNRRNTTAYCIRIRAHNSALSSEFKRSRQLSINLVIASPPPFKVFYFATLIEQFWRSGEHVSIRSTAQHLIYTKPKEAIKCILGYLETSKLVTLQRIIDFLWQLWCFVITRHGMALGLSRIDSYRHCHELEAARLDKWYV